MRPKEIVGDIAVLRSGKFLKYGSDVDEFESKVQVLVQEGRKLIVDLNNIEFIDSSGIGALVRARNSLVERNKILALVVPGEASLREKLRITKLDTVISIYETVDDARKALAHSLEAPA